MVTALTGSDVLLITQVSPVCICGGGNSKPERASRVSVPRQLARVPSNRPLAPAVEPFRGEGCVPAPAARTEYPRCGKAELSFCDGGIAACACIRACGGAGAGTGAGLEDRERVKGCRGCENRSKGGLLVVLQYGQFCYVCRDNMLTRSWLLGKVLTKCCRPPAGSATAVWYYCGPGVARRICAHQHCGAVMCVVEPSRRPFDRGLKNNGETCRYVKYRCIYDE